MVAGGEDEPDEDGGDGRQQQFGPKEEILNRVIQPSVPPRALKVVPGEGGGG